MCHFGLLLSIQCTVGPAGQLLGQLPDILIFRPSGEEGVPSITGAKESLLEAIKSRSALTGRVVLCGSWIAAAVCLLLETLSVRLSPNPI